MQVNDNHGFLISLKINFLKPFLFNSFVHFIWPKEQVFSTGYSLTF